MIEFIQAGVVESFDSAQDKLAYLPRTNFAAVAELVYAEVSKTSGSNPMSVRLRPAACFRQNLVRGALDSP